MSRLFIVISIFCCNLLFSQSFNNIVEEADFLSKNKDYYSAIYIYKKALNKKPNNIKLLYKYAEVLRKTYNYEESLKYYKKVHEINETYLNVKLWIGVLYKNLSQHDLSIKYLHQFIDFKNLNDTLYSKALIEIQSNKFIKKHKKDSLINVERMSNNINSIFSELSPYYYKGELYYNSVQADDNDNYKSSILYSEYKSGSFSINQKLDLIEDEKMHVSNLFFDEASNRFYFNKCSSIENNFLCNLYYADLENPHQHIYISDVNVSNFSSTQPFITYWKDKKVLFFSSNRLGGYGGFDIWYSEINNKEFKKPKNIGSLINTHGDEVTPFYDKKENIFYFSSDWHIGFGGLDIFSVNWIKDHWGKIQNMGEGINSNYNDLYMKFSYQGDTKMGFISSNRNSSLEIIDNHCCNDIYSFTILSNCFCDTVKQKNYSFIKLLPLKIYFDNDKPEKSKNDTIANKDYLFYYENYLKRRNDFIEVYSENLEGRFYKNAIDNMNYFFDTEIIKGKRSLDKLLLEITSLLDKGQNVKLIFKGFASPLTSKEYNTLLSKRRISSVKKYIEKYNKEILNKYLINQKLIILMMPFGEDTAPKFINDNPKDIKKSVFGINASRERRVEIIKIEVN
ncbi:MAG: hypothetical protein CMP58_04745 [Flavobacteriales bacterium]|nr:hypothetical protein [Flavobacteriales bacterium]MAZ01473.1 hypothetical protein [Flavobacteriales bacterium]